MNKARSATEVFNKCATEYQDKFMNVDLYKDSLDLFCNNILNKNARILELACGPGNITKYLLTRCPDLKILGIDLAPNMITLARINNPRAEFKIMDCRDIGTINEKYDAIMCSFCLPYLSKEEAVKLISNASELLTPGGIFYLSTMEDEYSKSGFKTSGSGDELYVYYHQADYLTHALEQNGFSIIDLQRLDSPTNDGTKITDLVIIAGK